MKEIDFKLWMPIQLIKSQSGSEEQVRIGGVAATEAEDLEGETLLMKGMDISYLKSGKGVFNWNHGNKPGDIVGRIDEANVDWAGDEEDMEYYLAMAFGSIRGAEIRSKGTDFLSEYFLWFNNDGMVTYQLDPEDLESFPAFLAKVKFSIENYIAFYL